MNRLMVLVLLVMALATTGCKKKVPTNIVQRSVRNAVRHSSSLATAMCGAKTRGLLTSTVTDVKIGKDNVGTAHIKGSPWKGEKTPSSCEGDVEFQYSSTARSSGTPKRRRHTTTWYLDHLRLTAVQTPGVTFESVDDTPDDDDDDD